MQDAADAASVVRWTNFDLGDRSIRDHVANGMRLTHLGIVFDNVGFSYRGSSRPVLEGLDLEVPVRKMTALTAETFGLKERGRLAEGFHADLVLFVVDGPLKSYEHDLLGRLAAMEKRLAGETATWDPRPAVGVVLAAGGYPGSYEKGRPISGLDAGFPDHVKVFHAGTALADGGVVTSGGRVLCVCALGENVTAAQAEAYRACEKIHWDGAFTRSDIGQKAVDREQGVA